MLGYAPEVELLRVNTIERGANGKFQSTIRAFSKWLGRQAAMRIGFYSVGFNTPAARYRVRQFFPHFAEHGIECNMHYAYGSAYNHVLHTELAGPCKLLTRAKRALHTLNVKPYDIVFLQRTAFPWTAIPERFARYATRRSSSTLTTPRFAWGKWRAARASPPNLRRCCGPSERGARGHSIP